MSQDTSAEARARYRDMLMALTPEQRLVMCTRMWADARALVIAGLADEPHPEGQSLRARIFLRMYGGDFEPAERARIVAWFNDRARESVVD
ncbi:MAG: hypothetical protein IPO18_07125 [bacterium]|jgi:hypothetical protein|nr:hypothetical protein [bacterium]